MVASLQNKKEALEAKLKDKTCELRKLCIEEAELTGVLPAETPIEPGEGPPQFRRRIGTAFTIPENLINKLNQKSKEDEAVAALELECKIQNGIAEAALGLANDVTASKSVRRKHKVLFDESKRRLIELEAKLNALKQQTQPKHKKKPRPHTEIVEENVEGDYDDSKDSFSNSGLPVAALRERSSNSMRHSHTYGALPKPEHIQAYPERMAQSHMHLPTIDYRLLEHLPHQHLVRSSNPSPIDHSMAMWNKGRESVHYNQSVIHPHYMAHSPEQFNVEPVAYHFNDRFRSLDRNSSHVETLPRNMNMYVPHSSTLVLLPSQTYPENSLMRTQSLGNMDSLKHPDRKAKEKEWYETSLDASPLKQSPVSEPPVSALPPSPPPPPIPVHASTKPVERSSPTVHSTTPTIPETNQASVNSIHFDTVVPYESPKNHTVVQAGKWQPYREVTKPFEMSDFYKYSTKFRQAKNSVQVTTTHHNQEQQAAQQKVVYKPPQPLECQPLSTTDVPLKHPQPASSQEHIPNYLPPPGWYNERHHSKPRSSTLV